MDQHDARSLPSAGDPATAPSTALETRNDGALDAHTRSLDDYDWVPVRRQPRSDGWSIQRQRGFIEALADCGSVTEAARAVNMSVSSAYKLRRSPGGEAFADAWNAAIQQATLHLVDVAFDRAVRGSDEPVFDRDGRRVGRRMRQNDRLLMFLLRAHLPERYAHAHRADRPAGAAVPAIAPVAQAIAALGPPLTADPERSMPPDRLADALELADICEGELPHWLRDRDGRADGDAPDLDPLGPGFEAALEAAKAEADAPAALPDAWYDDDDDDFEDDADETDHEDGEEDLDDATTP